MTSQLLGDCQLHTFHNKNIVHTSINAQNHQNLRIILKYSLAQNTKELRILRLSKTLGILIEECVDLKKFRGTLTFPSYRR